ncbi:MAG: adenylate kinase [Candidatus Pacebacteria bacterium]|nr:adenylate kinase [Candidatus Paceibacterota bacterium]
MSNYVFLGPPGAGKGTMADMLSEQFGFVHVSTGDILREEMASGSELGRQAQQFVNSGHLVTDEVVAAIVSRKLSDPQAALNGVILDGYPRTVKQADLLDGALEENSLTLDAVVLFEVERELLLQRLTARRICRGCGAVYNLLYDPPAEDDVCDRCGVELYQRSDDSEETAKQRLNVYQEQTAPLIDFYERRGQLIRVTGSKEKHKNYKLVQQALGL